MRVKAALFLVLFFSVSAYCANIPVFNMPPDDYKIFSHNEMSQKETQAQQSSEASQISSNLSISGIFKSQGKYFVLINHKVCKKGDTVDGYTIKSIESNKVVFVKNGVESTETLNKTPNIIFFSDDTVSNDNGSDH